MTGTMRAFEVHVNGKRLCVAGIGDDGVLNTMVDHVVGHGMNELYLRVGGLISPTMEHVRWTRRRLKTGDEVRVKIIESGSTDRPRKRYRLDPKEDLRAQKRYVREMARKFGWKVTTSQ
ncbi:MAG TPA: hypothetical protein VEU96_10110 [Bryobacteraceae bacterium]|nr:hypothetical protein [Bryobacteraceae bacterium]